MASITNLKELNEVKESDYSNIEYVRLYKCNLLGWCDELDKIFNFVNLKMLMMAFEVCPSKVPINKIALFQKLYKIDISYKCGKGVWYNEWHDYPINLALSYNNKTIITNNIGFLEMVVIDPNTEYINIFRDHFTQSFIDNLPQQIKKLRILWRHGMTNLKLNNLPTNLQELEIVLEKNAVLPEIKLPFGCKLNLIKI
jgi:hypothetical protein